MATYSTDLTTLTTAESGSWTEFTSPYQGGGNPGASGENFIQGTDCYAQNTGKAVGLEISCVFDNAANVTVTATHAVFMWIFYFAGTNLETYANSGWRIGIGSSTSAWDWFRVGGSDYSNHKLGGWRNFAIDPTATESGVIGGGNGGNYRYFGNVPYTLGEVTKGDPLAVDAIRHGRGLLSITGTGGSFDELASYNDYNAGGTPPGTSSTSVDSGRHVLGLFAAAGGGYSWKGLIAFGLSGTTVTFTDSNKTITIEDCPHTYAAFNKIEIRNAGSSVTWNNITLNSTATTANGVGYFEMTANATVALNGCTFNNFGTTILLSNATLTGCNFNSAGLITAGSATITGCAINISTSAASLIAGNNDMVNITSNDFTSDGSNHAVEINAVGTGSMTWDNILISYVSGVSGTNVATSSTGNEAIYLNFTSAATYTINVQTGATVPSVRKGAGFTGNVNVVAGAVSITITAATVTGTPISGARVFVEAGSTGNLPSDDSVTITRVSTTASVAHTGHGLVNGDKVVIRGADQNEYVGIKTISNVTTNAYDFTVTGTPTTPATGTILSSFVFISDVTNGSGIATSTARTLSADQSVTGRVRKSSGSPFYKTGQIVGTATTAAGLSTTVIMIVDE
jgi:hypothetical protein